MLMQQVWLQNMYLVDGMDEEKAVLVATTKCLCEFPPIQQSHPDLWAALRDVAIKKLGGELFSPLCHLLEMR
jgi:hypothetical protein